MKYKASANLNFSKKKKGHHNRTIGKKNYNYHIRKYIAKPAKHSSELQIKANNYRSSNHMPSS